MRRSRRPAGRRPSSTLATSASRAIRRESEFLGDPPRDESVPSTDDDSHPQDLPASSYVPYAQLYSQHNPRAPPSTKPHAPRFPRPFLEPPLAAPIDRHPESLSSEFDTDESDYFPHDDDRGDRDLLYVNENSPAAPRHSLTMPEVIAVAKDKLKKRLSFHIPRTAEKRSSGSEGEGRDRFRLGDRASLRKSFAGREDIRDFPSSSSSPSSTRVQQKGLPEGHMELKVRPWVLEGNGTGLRKTTSFGAWKKKVEPYRTVRVEANPASLAPTCLYASDQTTRHLIAEPYKATEFITGRPQWVCKDSIVYRDCPFEVGVVGMSVSAKDFSVGVAGQNELLMYSLHRDPEDDTGEGDALPYIHYDPAREGQMSGTEPDRFTPIPASRSLFMVSDGKVKGEESRRSVNVRFRVLELDKLDESVQMSLAGIQDLGKHISQFSQAAPLLGLLSPALSLASTVSRRALDAHAKPDKVITTDMNFLLAERQPAQLNSIDQTEIPYEHRSGEYLRYGYYFFLEDRVDAKLYASFRTFPNVELMLRRTEDKLQGHDKRYFPLTGVSYLVIRVTPRISSVHATRRPIRMSHVQRLEDLMQSSLLSDDAADATHMVQTLASLAKDLGIVRQTDANIEVVGGVRGEGREGPMEEGLGEGIANEMNSSERQVNTSGGGDSASS